MSALSLIVFLSALLATTSAQTSGPTVWASVAMIMHGERTPLRSELSNTLTPRGAQQLYAQGAAFRTRYLSGVTPTNTSEARITSRAAIRGITRNVVEHEQLSILSVQDAHIATGATAFVQALYPPLRQAFAADTGGTNISFSTTSGNFTQYPLDGYQYPVIQTPGMLDQRSIDLRGNTECTQWQISTRFDMTHDPEMLEMFESTLPNYQRLFRRPPLNDGVVSLANANFWDAYNIWDYVRYRRSHEQAFYRAMADTYDYDKQFLQLHAKNQQLAMNSDMEPSGLKKGDMIRTVAGRTFARRVVDALKANGNFAGYSNKMTLMFSSHEPFMSFFALAKLQNEEAPLASPFWNLPEHGAAMVFELIGDQPNDPERYPTEENLYVRFLYRANANADTPFVEHSLFGMPDGDSRVTFRYFKQEMLKFGLDVSGWCSTCASSQPFCSTLRNAPAPEPTLGESVRSAVQKPVVAGIIGASIILAVLGLVIVAAAVLGGFRIRRVGRDAGMDDNKDSGRAAGLGGFKAAEKRASDPDLSVSRRGLQHERQGSWELREGRDVVSGQAGIVVDKSSASFYSKNMDDDDMSDLGASPVKPRESV
ncbi:histidine acid phosphatase [Colletotrichum musicola]|uniref:Histidine acid phosphatase n=1 Tax=Colletotrichum musicola TaxID=2175873 RepID=A0A8H6NZ12_9PEZI|nr:histidine acid phosphatase [Colletotrichum musicola]